MSKQRFLPGTTPVDPQDSTFPETIRSAAQRFLLQDDPEASLSIELIDRYIDIPQDQFTSLLADSECEV